MKYALIVDDQEFNREIIRVYLEALSYEITQASNGEEAILIFEKTPDKFHLITMDYNMPGIDGVETITRIRTQNQAVPIIGVSAAASVMKHRLTKINNIRVLSKPLDKLAFELAIRELEFE